MEAVGVKAHKTSVVKLRARKAESKAVLMCRLGLSSTFGGRP